MAEKPDQVLHFNEYFRVIRNRFWVIFTIFILTVISGQYITEEVLPKVYKATAQIQIRHRNTPTTVGFLQDSNPEKGIDTADFQSDFEIMKSPTVLLPIIDEMGLDKIWAKRIFKSKLDKVPQSTALTYLNGILQLDAVHGTNIVTITASSDLPDEAAAIANAVADHYRAIRDDEQDQRNSLGVETMRTRIADEQKEVDKKKARVDELLNEAGTANVPIGPNANDQEESDLDAHKKDLLSAQEDFDARQVLFKSVQNLSDEEFLNTLAGLGGTDPNIASLRADSFRIEGDIQNLLKDGFDTNHPRILSMQAELARKQDQIKDLIAGKRRAMGVDVEMAQSRVALLQKIVDDQTTKIRDDTTQHLEPYRDAKNDLDKEQSVLDVYNLHLQQLLTDKQLLETPVYIFSPAVAPENPTSPNKKTNMIISVVGGLCVGILVAFLIEYLDTSVKTMADAESLLGLPVLTVIPNKGGPLPLVADSGRLPHAEGYRILRAKLDLKVQNGVGPSVSMLSGGPGEGKSTTVFNLAVICAQAGQSVLLIDCDLRRPTIHTLADLPNDRGMANYLRGEGDAVEYIQQTALPKLHVLTSGDMPLSDIGVLAGDKIRAMLEDLKMRYDIVLIDAPPVLGISDGSIIAREVDYVILVIQHRRYPREISLRAKRAIEEVHGNCVGMVLNSVSVNSDDSYYYYSNYGNYYKNADRKKRKSSSKAKTNGSAVSAPGRGKPLDSDDF